MDVGSTKRDVIDAARRALREQIGCFVPAHPIAGKELSGVENADADLYQGRQVVLTPIERTSHVQLQQAIDVWTALGCRVVKMTPEAHDAAFAAVSHLPHLIAFAAHECNRRSADGRGLPVTGRARFSRFHPHRRVRPRRCGATS